MGYTTYKIHPILKLDLMFRINEELHVEIKKINKNNDCDYNIMI